MEQPTPYLKNRLTGVILPYNEHLAKHPDMFPCEKLPYPKEVKKPTTPTHRRHLADKAKKEAAEKEAQAEKPKKQAPPLGKKAAEAETPGDAEVDDLLAGIEHG